MWPGRTTRLDAAWRSAPIDPVFPALVAVRWVHFASMAVLFGGALFWLVAAAPAAWPSAARGTLRLSRVAAVLAALSGVGWELAIVADMAGDPAAALDPAFLRTVFLASPFGPVLIARLVLLGALVASAGRWAPRPATKYRTTPTPGPSPRGEPRGIAEQADARAAALTRGRSSLAITAVVAALLLVTQAWLGHAAMGGYSPLGVAMMLAYACHILAVAAWVGGLPPLLLALREARGATILPLLRRVSMLATGAVAVLVAAGVVNSAFRLDSFADLFATPYGRVLLAKLALTGAMLGIAAYNRRAVRAASPSDLPLSVAAELGLGIVVLGAAALLGVTPPPR